MAQNFFPTVLELITTALTDIGAIDPEGGVTPNSSQTAAAWTSLRYLITSWQSHGLQLWCRDTFGNGALIAGQEEYSIGSGANFAITHGPPKTIERVWLRDSDGYDHVVTLISREEYQRLSTKESTGIPTVAYYDPRYALPYSNTGGTNHHYITFWPSPTATEVAEYEVWFDFTRAIYDNNATSEVLDFPQEWYNAIRWNLAHQLCFQYEVPLGKIREIKSLAEDSLDLAMAFDTERTSMFISPAQR